MKTIYVYSWAVNQAFAKQVDNNEEGILTKPPVVKEGECYYPDGGVWKVVKDLRGSIVTNKTTGEERMITELTDKVGKNETLLQRTNDKEIWNDIDKCWEMPRKLMLQEELENIKDKLRDLDLQSIRPLEAKVLNIATKQDDAKLLEIQDKKNSLRKEYQAIVDEIKEL